MSVDPVTATLPVVPGSVHSGVPALSGAAVGQAGACASDEGAEPQAVSAATDTAQTANVNEDGKLRNFIGTTLPPLRDRFGHGPGTGMPET